MKVCYVVRQFEPTELRVMLLDKRVHRSAAREEYTCNWVFEYANLKDKGLVGLGIAEVPKCRGKGVHRNGRRFSAEQDA
jgi:hypothetical protein